ncbi:MAG: hypothetical protein Q9227_005580 [Pyrenula ochraceoflavens]
MPERLKRTTIQAVARETSISSKSAQKSKTRNSTNEATGSTTLSRATSSTSDSSDGCNSSDERNKSRATGTFSRASMSTKMSNELNKAGQSEKSQPDRRSRLTQARKRSSQEANFCDSDETGRLSKTQRIPPKSASQHRNTLTSDEKPPGTSKKLAHGYDSRETLSEYPLNSLLNTSEPLSDTESSYDEDSQILNLTRPKPDISSQPRSSLQTRLSTFLPQIKAANEALRSHIVSADHQLDHVSDGEEQYIELDLGLGVLKERRPEKEIDGVRIKGTEESQDESDEDERANALLDRRSLE